MGDDDMNVKCTDDVFSFSGELIFKCGEVYPTSVYKDMLSAQTESRKAYPLGYEVVATDLNHNWSNDEWFSKRFQIID